MVRSWRSFTTWKSFSRKTKNHGSRYAFKQRLAKKTMLKPKKGFPKIRGRASDVQSLDHTLLALFSAHMLEDNLQHGPRYGFPALPAEQARKEFQLGCQMAQLRTMLMIIYKEQGRAIFSQTSKTHFVLHSLMLSRFTHPSMTWCYKGESTMHRLQVLWQSCIPGVKHWRAAKKAILKDRHLLYQKHKIKAG